MKTALRNVSALMTLALISACGMNSKTASSDDTVAAQQPPVTQAPPSAAPETGTDAAPTSEVTLAQEIPQGAIVRVPLDEQANLIGEPEFRTSASRVGRPNGPDLANSWSAGRPPESMYDRNNNSHQRPDASRQAWASWGSDQGPQYSNQQMGPWNRGGNDRDGRRMHQQPQRQQQQGRNDRDHSPRRGNEFWQNTYRPTLNWRGRGWDYQYSGCYDHNQYRYFYYQAGTSRR